MKPVVTIIGLILIIFGLFSLGYNGFTYTSREKIAQLGSLQVTADTEKTVYLDPRLAGASLLVGIILVVVGRMKP